MFLKKKKKGNQQIISERPHLNNVPGSVLYPEEQFGLFRFFHFICTNNQSEVYEFYFVRKVFGAGNPDSVRNIRRGPLLSKMVEVFRFHP